MHVNPKELQKFLDVWQPVIAALPAVINAAEREQELTRNLATLESQLQKTLCDIDSTVAQKAERVTAVEAEIQALIARKLELAVELKDSARDIKAEIAAAKKAATAKVKEHESVMLEAESAITASRKDLESKLAAAEAEFEAQKTEKQKQIDELEAKRALAEQALSDLRSKLG